MFDDNIWSSNNALIFDFSPSLNRKIHLVGTLGGSKVKLSNSFQKNREKQKKNDRKTGIFTQNQFSSFRQNRIIYFAITQKLIDENT